METYFLDLFSGIGGFAKGAHGAGLRFTRHFYSEVDPYAIKVYGARFPDAEPLGDIKAIRGEDLPRGQWIITGGFPCQDISVAGNGAGLAGARSGLWYEYARIIGELRPRFAIMENVGALAFRGLDSVLGSLAALGYDAEWQDIRASDVGAPHRRERLWIVAYPDAMHGAGSPESREQLERPAQSPRSGADGVEAGDDVADADNSRRNASRPAVASGRAEKSAMSRNASQRGRGNEWWATEPDVGRVAHGIPARVDRLKCLGNSIVPKVAELIFRQSAFDEWRI
jgi:DNA (cytosine-5)-methyltransferase 1